MGCCSSNRPSNSLPSGISDLPLPPRHSDSVHLLLIKAYREKNASLAISLLASTAPLRLKFRVKRLEKVQSFVCYLLASWSDQFSTVIQSGSLAKMLELSGEDKHALSALYMMTAESIEVAVSVLALKPLERLILVYGRDKQTSLIVTLLIGLLAIHDVGFAVSVVTAGGLGCALKVYSDLHHFEAKRDMLKAMYTVLSQAQTHLTPTQKAALSLTISQANDVSLIRLQRLLDSPV